ncbi:MAG: hypothetical protein LJE65_14545 [Desulfobacteraceae bacterium]|nr:hypothetical protein [Desulfobacteraceae bacterium]
MKDAGNLHLKVQEMIDCYKNTDPLREMSLLKSDADIEEAAVKWIALAALHGINHNAKKIHISRKPGGEVRVVAEYHDSELPSPGSDVGSRVFDTVRQITHIEEDKGKLPLALGVGDSSVDVKVKIQSKKGKEKISIRF